MRVYYSASIKGFCLAGLNAIPADAVEITVEEYRALLDAQAQGKQIEPDANGRPVAVEPPAPTFEEQRQAKLDRIHAEKCRARDSGFYVNGILFDSDLAARTAYAELALALQQDPALSTRWRASEGQWVTMDAAMFADVHAAGRAHIESCFAWQEARELEIAEATTLAELEAISETYTAPEA